MKSLAAVSVLSKVLAEEEICPARIQTDSTDPAIDDLLMSRVQEGDSHAMEVLFHNYSGLVHSVGIRILRDREEARELVQDVFLCIYRKRQLYNRAKGAFRSWLLQIAYHRAFDRRQHLQVRHFYREASLSDARAEFVDSASTEDQLDWALFADALHRAFDELNEKQRVTLELYFFQGYTLREISERSGESLANVRHHYYRGLESLRRSTFVMSLRVR